MKKVVLQKYDKFFLEGNFFLVKKGKVISREVLETGKAVSNENYIKEGEIVGNFFNFLSEKEKLVPEVEIEVEALENDTILEEFNLNTREIFNDKYIQKILDQLVKKSMIKFFYQIYDTKGYILIILKLCLNKEKYISKKEINYENFNISKSNFYLIYSKLKEEKFISERNNRIYLNVNKTDRYLKQFIEKE